MKTKKLISLCLILALLASLLCLPAAAAEGADWDALSAALEKGGEVKLSAACGGGEVSGIFDLYDPAEGKVVDWKTTSVWKIVKGEFDDWRDQLLTYCWLISQRDGSTPCRAEIVAVLRDWSASKAGEAGYPPTQVAVVGFDFDEDEVAAHGEELAQRVDTLMELEGAPDDGLPMCTPEQRWAKPDVWAVMKEGRKTAVKLFDDEEDAEKMAAAKGAGHYVDLRPGTDGKCGRYCPASPFCSYWLGKQEEGGPR